MKGSHAYMDLKPDKSVSEHVCVFEGGDSVKWIAGSPEPIFVRRLPCCYGPPGVHSLDPNRGNSTSRTDMLS